MSLKEKVKNLPSSPGVYLMKDYRGEIIYVGKAKNLKKRVQTYFQRSQNHSAKVEKLVKTIRDFDIIHTDTEFEAFLQECQLIQEIKPYYNSKMKNPLKYSYIEIQAKQEYARLIVTNSPNENSLYFGPYASKGTVERALESLNKYFRIECSNPSRRDSACLNYSLGLCIGMCLGGPAVEQYNEIIRKVISLLDGTDIDLIQEIETKMHVSAEQFDFKAATQYRDILEQVTYLSNRQKVIDFTEANQNIMVFEHLQEENMKLFLIKGNKVLFKEILLIDIDVIPTIVNYVYMYFTTDNRSNPITRYEIDEAQIIYSYLKKSDSSYTIIPDPWLRDDRTEEITNAIQTFLSNHKEMPSNV